MTVFVSYSRVDAVAAERVADTVAATGIEVWRDLHVKAGQAWWSEIITQIESCAAFIVVLTPSYLFSEACQLESARAEQCQRPILPIQVGYVDLDGAPQFKATQVFKANSDQSLSDGRLEDALRALLTKSAPVRSQLQIPGLPGSSIEWLVKRSSDHMDRPNQRNYVSALAAHATRGEDISPAIRSFIKANRDPDASVQARLTALAHALGFQLAYQVTPAEQVEPILVKESWFVVRRLVRSIRRMWSKAIRKLTRGRLEESPFVPIDD